ncbi:TonB-dependent receptor [Candidatus Poribacteria bacterium]|nr:TonB-dependent receptor [Candidatus Poribacteria bacterium]
MKKTGIHYVLKGLFTLLTVLVTTSVYAQTATLRGTVTDGQTREGIPLATISVTSAGMEGQPTRTAAGATGEFEIKGLAAGIYTVSVSHIAYAPAVLEGIELTAGETKSLEVSLSSRVFRLPDVTTVSRHPEKFLEAPASVSALDASQIRDIASPTPTELVKSLPAVDVVSSGLTQSDVAVRGFNLVFGGALLALVDNRIARMPSLSANVYSLIPTTNEDIERIEVVSGPGSALYGPYSANGVMHILTKPPFGSEGTTFSLGGGERSVLMGSFRHASSYNKRVGYKISGQYYQGNDWKYDDPEEVKLRQGKIKAGGDAGKIGQRDFDVEKLNGEARLDLRLTDNLTTILSSGFTRANQINLTPIGALQFKDWTYSYLQGRMLYKNLFAQAFLNHSDSGDTFNLRTAAPIIDKSSVLVGQIQYGSKLGKKQRFTYGLDLLLTRPDTEGTINGRNEGNDDINEIGAYLQSETTLTSKLKFVTAGRIDHHSGIEDPVFSPRAALVFKPNVNHNFRATYNRAFRPPSTNNLFLDIPAGAMPNPFGPNKDLASIRARGVPSTGWTFHRGADGRPQMYSQFDSVDGYADATINNVWPSFRSILVAQTPELGDALPTQLNQTVNGIFRNLTTGGVMADVTDVKPIQPAITNTFEVGYKGLIEDKLILAVDAYRTNQKDFISPLMLITPNVFADGATLAPVLIADITTRLVAGGLPKDQAMAQAKAIAEKILPTIAKIPFGVISPEQVQNDTEVILTYRNFGSISVYGTDLNFTYLKGNWNFSGNYSYVSKDLFKNVDGVIDIALNAPKHKFGGSIQYLNSKAGLSTQLRLHYVDGFPVNAGAYVGEVNSYAVLDLNAGYDLPFSRNTRLSLTIQNLLNNKHQEFIGAPEIGRLAMVRLTQSF